MFKWVLWVNELWVESMSYESKKSGFIVFNFFHFYVHQEVIFCLFRFVCLYMQVLCLYASEFYEILGKEYSYARNQSIN
jgi:hypothetical protein